VEIKYLEGEISAVVEQLHFEPGRVLGRVPQERPPSRGKIARGSAKGEERKRNQYGAFGEREKMY